MIDQYGDIIEEYNRDLIEGGSIFDHTVPHINYWVGTNGVCSRNRNYTSTDDIEVFLNKAMMSEITMHVNMKMKEGKVFWRECMIN